MKRIVTLITVLALGSALSVSAQDPIMSKKGTPIVYEAGDWGLAIDANPFLEYFGNLFNNTNNNSSPSWNFPNNDMVIHGFMIKDANTALRAKVRIGFGSTTDVFTVGDDLDTVTSVNPVKRRVEDELKRSRRNITLGLGIQKMRGKGRLKGNYGAEAMIGFGGEKSEVTYGNNFSATNTNPTSNSNLNSILGQTGGNGRTTETKGPSFFMLAVRGFIGAEYFFAPKISVAGEFGWGPALTSSGEVESTTDNVITDPNTGAFAGTRSVTVVTQGKSSSFSIDTDNASGSIRLGFYF